MGASSIHDPESCSYVRDGSTGKCGSSQTRNYSNRGLPKENVRLVYAVDFETYYDKEVAIQNLGTWAYLRHEKADIYLVSIFGPDVDYVGHPNDAPWDKISKAVWVSHNQSFDGAVFERLLEQKIVLEEHRPSDWQCTANLSVYLGAPRSLAEASKVLLGSEMNKDMRFWMKGRTWQDAIEQGKSEALIDYARQDAIKCWELWDKHAHKWPRQERQLAAITTAMGWHGLYLNQDRIREGVKHLKGLMWEADQKIPWAGELKEDGKEVPRMSLPRLAQECRKEGIPAPVSVAKDSPECDEWLETYDEKFPWVMALRTYRSANALCKKLETMLVRVRPDGRMPFGLKYWGAHTGRWSGDAGWNPQNLHKEATFGVEIRRTIIPAPGKKFIIVDLSQIEPRVQAWITRDIAFLNLCAKGMSPYEAHARETMQWTGGELKREEPARYALAKARILALGYAAGYRKFITMVKKYIPEPKYLEEIFGASVEKKDVDSFLRWLHHVGNQEWIDEYNNCDEREKLTRVNSWLIVKSFRDSAPQNQKLWDELDTCFKRSLKDGKFELGLPSGRSLVYRRISCSGGSWTAVTGYGNRREKFYGGKLTENLVQATARDVFAECTLRIWNRGYQIVLSVHDELVIECDKTTTLQEILDLMQEPVSWLPGCPIAADGHEVMEYCK